MRNTPSPYPPGRPPPALAAAFVLAAWTLAPAQSADPPPEGLQWGPVVLTPSLLVGYAYDSNVFQQSVILEPEGDEVLNVEPTLTLLVPFSNSSFRLEDRFRWRDYAQTPQLSGRSSNEMEAELELNFSSRDALRIGGERVNGVAETLVFDPGGEVVFSGESYRAYDIHGEIARDAPGTRGYRVEIGNEALRFDPSSSIDFFDYRGWYVEASYLEPLRPSTSLSMSYRGDRYDHFSPDSPGAPFRKEYGDAVFLGMEGRLASRRPYSFRVGWQELRFTGNAAPDFDGVVFNGNIALAGGRATIVTLGADRAAHRSFFFDNNFYVFEDVRVGVLHRLWRSSSLGASVTLGRLTYRDPVPPPSDQAGLLREDRTVWIDAYANFAIRDRVAFRVSLRRTNRRSNFDSGVFDQNVVLGGIVLGWF